MISQINEDGAKKNEENLKCNNAKRNEILRNFECSTTGKKRKHSIMASVYENFEPLVPTKAFTIGEIDPLREHEIASAPLSPNPVPGMVLIC